LIRVPLSKQILFDRLTNCVIYADVIADQINFDITAAEPIMLVNSEGYVVIED